MFSFRNSRDLRKHSNDKRSGSRASAFPQALPATRKICFPSDEANVKPFITNCKTRTVSHMRIKLRIWVAADDLVAQKAHMHVMMAQHRIVCQRRVYDVFIISAVVVVFFHRNLAACDENH